MIGPVIPAPAASPRQRTAVARLLHERAARQRFVAVCMTYLRRQGLRPTAADPAGRSRPEETWIHGILSVRRRTLIGAVSLGLVPALVVVLLGAAPWVGLLVAAALVGIVLVLAWRSRRPAIAIVHASTRPLSAKRLVALCHELQDDEEPWAMWVFSRGGFDLSALEAARAYKVRCFERNGHGFDEYPPRSLRSSLAWPGRPDRARRAA